jgi:hypothetical protein
MLFNLLVLHCECLQACAEHRRHFPTTQDVSPIEFDMFGPPDTHRPNLLGGSAASPMDCDMSPLSDVHSLNIAR